VYTAKFMILFLLAWELWQLYSREGG